MLVYRKIYRQLTNIALIASCVMLASIDRSRADTVCPPLSQGCTGIAPETQPISSQALHEYAGYFKKSDTDFWRILPYGRRLYILFNNTTYTRLQQLSKTEFLFSSGDHVRVIFDFGPNGLPDSVKIVHDPIDAYEENAAGVQSFYGHVPAREQTAYRISEASALSMYKKQELEYRVLLEARAPRPAPLSDKLMEEIKARIVFVIDILDKDGPFEIVKGNVENMDYLGRSSQGEYVIKVTRERCVDYWRMVLNSENEIISSSSSPSL